MKVRTIAPAKINWTLEVLGKRPDGYHEIRSVMQTIDLCDEISVSSSAWPRARTPIPDDLTPGSVFVWVPPQGFVYRVAGQDSGGEGLHGESVIRAVALLDPDGLKEVRTELTKKIPIAAGLGGGSSDAAAALRALDRLWHLELSRDEFQGYATEIGSDVPFFLSGGTALAEGRGERVTPLPDAPEAWLVVVAPPVWVKEKTKRMYEALTAADFGGGRTEALVERLGRGEQVRGEDMCNAFERAAYESFSALAGYRERLLEAGAAGVHLAGAGPALFAVFGSREDADGVAGRLEGTDARVFVARTLGAGEATWVEVS